MWYYGRYIFLKEIYNYISEEQENVVFENNRIEPLNNGSVQIKTGDLSPVFPSLLQKCCVIGIG